MNRAHTASRAGGWTSPTTPRVRRVKSVVATSTICSFCGAANLAPVFLLICYVSHYSGEKRSCNQPSRTDRDPLGVSRTQFLCGKLCAFAADPRSGKTFIEVIHEQVGCTCHPLAAGYETVSHLRSVPSPLSAGKAIGSGEF